MGLEKRLGRSLALVALVGCGGGESEEMFFVEGASAVEATPRLETFIVDSLQIDRIGSALSYGDSNLSAGADMADGTPSTADPPGGPGRYIDWHEMVLDDAGQLSPVRLANHRLMDLNDAAGKDRSSFPRSNECVGASSVLSKMDLTYVASANNAVYAYFGAQRASNSGDAAYYWLFTHLAPRLAAGEAPCRAGESRLVYELTGADPATGTGGDVLLAGHFHPSSAPLLRVFRARQGLSAVGAIQVIDFTNTALWREDPAAVAAATVNTTVTAPGAFGAAGVSALTRTGQLDKELFAEVAVPLSLFAGAPGASCGATYYGTVLTRSSGSGGTSPDLKDLAGPAVFNFGQPSATARLTPSCGTEVTYEVTTAIGADGLPMHGAECRWTFGDGSTSQSCSGTIELPTGRHAATVVVTDPLFRCQTVAAAAEVVVAPPLEVSAQLAAAACAPSFSYQAAVSGGSGTPLAYQWTFSGPGTTSPAVSSSQSGSVEVGQPGAEYSGTVVVTEQRADGLWCTASASASATPYAPTTASAALAPTCGAAVRYAIAGATGADGGALAAPVCLWTFDNGSTAASCSGLMELPQGTHSARVTVTDPVSGCSAEVGTGAVQIWAPLEVRAELSAAACSPSFGYRAVVSGGSGAVSYAWIFSGEGAPSPAASNLAGGNVDVDQPGVATTGSVLVTDLRADGLDCAAAASAGVTPLSSMTAAAELTPTCDLALGYALTSATTPGGAPLVSPSCLWTFDDGTTSAGCSGTAELAAGRHTAAVRVTDPASGCWIAVAPAAATVYPPLRATAELTGTCSLTIAYQAGAAGGAGGALGYAWTFAGSGAVSPAASAAQAGTVAVDAPGTAYNGTVVVTERRPDGLSCTATAADDGSAAAPIEVHLRAVSAGGACPALASDQVTYEAVVSGGSGAVDYAWSGAPGCSGARCTIDSDDSTLCAQGTLSVTASDPSGFCPPATSETESWSKVTVIQASDR